MTRRERLMQNYRVRGRLAPSIRPSAIYIVCLPHYVFYSKTGERAKFDASRTGEGPAKLMTVNLAHGIQLYGFHVSPSHGRMSDETTYRYARSL